MCGIYGITAHDPEFIQNFIRKCEHRGPDGHKIWWDPDHQVVNPTMEDTKRKHTCLQWRDLQLL